MINSIANIYIYNNQKLITQYIEKSIRVKGSIANRVSLSRGKIKIYHVKKNGSKSLVLTLTNIFYLSNNSSNFIILNLLNNIGIYYHNKDQILYNQSTWKILAFVKKYKTSFPLYLFHLSLIAMNLLRKYEVYKRPKVI